MDFDGFFRLFFFVTSEPIHLNLITLEAESSVPGFPGLQMRRGLWGFDMLRPLKVLGLRQQKSEENEKWVSSQFSVFVGLL